MRKRQEILYIFNLQNTQEQYAQCLEFITILQNRSTIIDKNERIKRIRQLVSVLRVTGMWAPNHAKNYYEEPLKFNGRITPPSITLGKELKPDGVQMPILDGSMQFHIRIHLNRDEKMQVSHLANLHYLALLLQRLDDILVPEHDNKTDINKLKQRVSVFIVPYSASVYPFKNQDGKVDFETYQIVSSYLRLLSKRYTGIIYGVVQRNESIAVRALDFRRATRLNDAFPLIPLNGQTYPKLFEEAVTSNTINNLFALRKRGRFPGALDVDPYKALSAFIAETAYYHLRDLITQLGREDNVTILRQIENWVQTWADRNHICLISFTIFLFTFCTPTQDGKTMEKVIQQHMEFAEELGAGLRQLAQNTLQHSVSHEGVISFYLERNRKDVALQLFLSDFNDQQTFVDNFVANLCREIEYTDNAELKQRYVELSQHKESISLGHFFGEHGGKKPDDAWIKFRQIDTSAHIGLLLFSMTMQRCGGTLQLINSTGYSVQPQNYFFHCYEKESVQLEPSKPKCRIIPGTHLALTVPVGAVEELRPKGLGQLSMELSIQETYKSYALYLDHQPVEVDFSDIEFQKIMHCENMNCAEISRNAPVIDAMAKYKMVYCWERYWYQYATNGHSKCDTQVHFFDVATLPNYYLDSADKIEIFVKGFINALDALCQESKTLLFAFTNASPLFLQNFRQITIALAPKKFPNSLQIFVISADLAESIHLIGDSFCQAISNAYMLALEHGTQAYSLNEVNRAKNLFFQAGIVEEIMDGSKQKNGKRPQSVCPFNVILPSPMCPTLSMFDEQIRQLADGPLDKSAIGYKLENIHMRLGSKVHIRAFYEMAFLFYRTGISNRIAFEILRSLKECKNASSGSQVDLLANDIIFYGYASYSKALLTSMLEILKAYRVYILTKMSNSASDGEKAEIEEKIRHIPEHLAYVTYQHNLQSDFQVEDTELYFNFYNHVLGERLNKDKVCFNRPVQIVQIVPISSTLTTFDKMEARIKTAVQGNHLETVARYTVFWVTDKLAELESNPRKETEAKYWEKVDTTNRQIFRKSKCGQRDAASITYFMRSPVVWEDPLKCELCYPENVIAEVPLVETDQTSTVPALQLRGQKLPIGAQKEDHEENDRRLIKLKSCVIYGHTRREKNHFQFYLETQNYFNRVSADVKKWLEGLSNENKQFNKASASVLNIIFSPEHATNVGFAQYVNNYYFDGNAEIVCVNEGKEYRSNFSCEHMALSRTIGDLMENAPLAENPPVCFYFVDDTIITGETFHKAVSLLHTLIPIKYQDRFPANLISKCFLLVDRLSKESKRNYVRNVERDFLSFLHIDLSNMRVQGDSCVGCKLEINANKLFKRSATRNIANFWADKAERFTVRGYSKCALMQPPSDRDKAFHKLVLSHITQNVFFNDNEYFELGSIYDSILTIIAKILGEQTMLEVSFQYDLLMKELRKDSDCIELLKDFLKLISRPFFSFDFKARLQSQTLLLIFSEFLINCNEFSQQKMEKSEALMESPYKSFLFAKGRIAETFRLLQKVKLNYLPTKENQIDFFQDCLMDCLVELRSTYMMRKSTIAKLFHFLMVNEPQNRPKEHSKSTVFWREYVAGIHQILDCNSDETRALWLEYLLISGEEYIEFREKYPSESIQSFEPHSLFDLLTENYPVGRDSAFFYFCNELFLQNNRVLFDGIENYLAENALDSASSMEYWRRGRSLDRFYTHTIDEVPSEAEQELFATLKKLDESGREYKVTELYKGLLDKIVAMAQKKYDFERIDIALITCLEEGGSASNESPGIGQMDIVSCSLSSTQDLHFNKYEIKKKLAKSLSTSDGLRSYGYQMSQQIDNSSYFFIYFDSQDNPIVPVYLYFSSPISKEYDKFNLMLLLRDILSYRNRMLKTLRLDFAGDIFSKYAHTSGEKSILAHEKATSHNTTGDDSVTLEIFMDPKSISKYSMLDSSQVLKWLLLHNYTNAQIAKLFNRSYRTHEEYDNSINFPSPPPLYLRDVGREQMKELSWFERPLRNFSDLRLSEDGRIALLDTIVSLDIKEIKHAKFLKNNEDEFYNVEYFKNILIDVIISAMKYGTASAAYLERVDKYLEGAKKLRHQELLTDEMLERLQKGQCWIQCTIEETKDEEATFNYMVIRNKVNKLAHNLFDWKTHNQSIQARLESPIDYADGHMSLLAISQYIEGLWPKKLRRKTKFEYVEREGQLMFETRLPIIEKE